SDQLAQAEDVVKLTFKSNRRSCGVYGGGHSLCIHWEVFYSNSLDHSGLTISLWKGYVPLDGDFVIPRERTKLSDSTWHLTLSLAGNPEWKEGGSGQLHSTRDLARTYIEMLFQKMGEKGN
ncbi:MAG TPA: hypothetical protein DDX89_02510, partial [Candidatus Omnitrophica bacterium]|nr:hypothetical protein [Candidatus Omnitrophota bacterium]